MPNPSGYVYCRWMEDGSISPSIHVRPLADRLLMSYIFHITSRPAWETAQALGVYQDESLATEGFIHCSTHEQVLFVANAFFQGQSDLLLLKIDPDRLQSELRYDDVEPLGHFPHLYGPLNTNAVVQVVDFVPAGDGTFQWPEAVLPE